jgi:hypothetical protein
MKFFKLFLLTITLVSAPVFAKKSDSDSTFQRILTQVQESVGVPIEFSPDLSLRGKEHGLALLLTLTKNEDLRDLSRDFRSIYLNAALTRSTDTLGRLFVRVQSTPEEIISLILSERPGPTLIFPSPKKEEKPLPDRLRDFAVDLPMPRALVIASPVSILIDNRLSEVAQKRVLLKARALVVTLKRALLHRCDQVDFSEVMITDSVDAPKITEGLLAIPPDFPFSLLPYFL